MGNLPYWDFTGSTLVTSNYIRLTPDIQSRSGAIWNSVVNKLKLMFFYRFNVISQKNNCIFFRKKAVYVTKLGSKCQLQSERKG